MLPQQRMSYVITLLLVINGAANAVPNKHNQNLCLNYWNLFVLDSLWSAPRVPTVKQEDLNNLQKSLTPKKKKASAKKVKTYRYIKSPTSTNLKSSNELSEIKTESVKSNITGSNKGNPEYNLLAGMIKGKIAQDILYREMIKNKSQKKHARKKALNNEISEALLDYYSQDNAFDSDEDISPAPSPKKLAIKTHGDITFNYRTY